MNWRNQLCTFGCLFILCIYATGCGSSNQPGNAGETDGGEVVTDEGPFTPFVEDSSNSEGAYPWLTADGKYKFAGRDKLPDSSPVVKMTAIEFDEAFSADPPPVEKYRDSIIEVTGEVLTMVVWDRSGVPDVAVTLFQSDTGSLKNGSCTCLLRDSKPWEKFNRGQTITLRGQLNDRPDYPDQPEILDFGEIVSTDGEPVKKFTAVELTKSFVADPSMLDDLQEKLVIVSGEVESVEQFKGINLKNESGITLQIESPLSGGRSANEFKAGDSITLMALVSPNRTQDPEEMLQLGKGAVIPE